MKKATILFCIRDGQVLLAKKTKKVGSGKWNGYGGKVEDGENIEDATVREMKEESGGVLVAKEDLEKVAIVKFSFGGVPAFECFVYVTHKWQGKPKETTEMVLPTWHHISNMPFSEMMPADKDWITLVLVEGKKIEANVNFNEDGTEVTKFDWKPATFT